MFGFTMTRPLTGLPKASAEKSPVRIAREGIESCKDDAVELILLFAVDEEECLVLANRAADRASELVQVELLGLGPQSSSWHRVTVLRKKFDREIRGRRSSRTWW